MSEEQKKRFLSAEDLISISTAAKGAPYSAEYLSLLARKGRLPAVKISRDWLTTPKAVSWYVQKQEKKHRGLIERFDLIKSQKGFAGTGILIVSALLIFSVAVFLFAVRSAESNYAKKSSITLFPSQIKSGFGHLAVGVKTFLSAAPNKLTYTLVDNVGILNQLAREDFFSAVPESRSVINSGRSLSGIPLRGGNDTWESEDENSVWNNSPADRYGAQSVVLGESLKNQPPSDSPQAGKVLAANEPDFIGGLIEQILNRYLAEGKFKGEKGDKGDPGFGTGIFKNDNGNSTAAIGNTSIVTYVPSVPAQGFDGTSLAGFGQLSSQNFYSQTAVIDDTFTVQGSTALASLNVSGAFSAATTSLSSLTVSGDVTLNGSTTIAGLTIAGLNPGLTPGSVLFQGASAISEDSSNFYWDAGNGRLGLGTTTPAQLLSVAGNMRLTGALFDYTNASGTLGMVLKSTGTGTEWVATSTLGITGGSGVSGGTNGYVARFTAADALSTGILLDNGTVAGVNATSSSYTFNIQGSSGTSPFNISSSTGTSLVTVDQRGYAGIGTTTPAQLLSVAGNMRLTGALFDSSNASGTTGQILSSTGTGTAWISTSTLVGGNAITNLNGLTASSQTFATGSATGIGLNITSSGSVHTFTPTVSGGYLIPLIASTTEWSTAYGWGDHSVEGYLASAITSLAGLTGATQTISTSTSGGLDLKVVSSSDDHQFQISLDSGYIIPTTTPWSNLNNFYNTPSTRITAGTNLSWSTNILNIDDVFPTYTYASSTFPSFTYASSTFATIANYPTYTYASSTFPSFTYASSTFATLANLLNYPTYTYGSSTYVSFGYASSTFATILNYPTYSYASSTFSTYAYGSSTYVSFGYGSSTFATIANYPTYTYASSTFATVADLLNYPSYTYGSSTYVSFGYASSTFATILNYPTYSYASSTFPSFSYSSNTFATILSYPTYTYASSTFVTAVTGTGNISSTGGLTPQISFTGVLPITNGGTATTSSPTLAGQLLGAHASGSYGVVNLLAGSNIAITTSTPGQITIASTGGSGSSAWTLGPGLIYNATSTDLVGIGTITPTTTLFIQGKAGVSPFAIASSSGSQLLAVTQAGDVGVGVESPQSRLHVGGILRIETGDFYTSSDKLIFAASGTPTSFYHSISTAHSNSGDGYNKMTFSLSNAASGAVTVMTLTGAGNVGIGTSSPSQKLDVWGNLIVATSSTPILSANSATRRVGIGTSSPRSALHVVQPLTTDAGDEGVAYFDAYSGASNNTPWIRIRAARGTPEAPSAVNANDPIGGIGAGAYHSGGDFTSNARVNIRFFAAENFTDTNQGAYMQFSTTPAGATTPQIRLAILDSGNVGIGTTSPGAKLHIGSVAAGGNVRVANGWLCVDDNDTCTGASTAGTIYATNGTVSGGADVAENYPTLDSSLEFGDVVVADTGFPVYIKKSNSTETSSSDLVIGIVSTKPGVLLGHNQDFANASSIPVALAGRVPVKVTNENGNIKLGDYVTVSKTKDGYAAKAIAPGYVIGQALENFDGSEPVGTSSKDTILVFVGKTYFVPKVADILQNSPDPGLSGDILAELNLNDAYAFTGLVITNNVYVGRKLVVGERIETVELIAVKIIADEIITKKLCVDDICVTREQFKSMVEFYAEQDSSAVLESEGEVAGESVPDQNSPPDEPENSLVINEEVNNQPVEDSVPEEASGAAGSSSDSEPSVVESPTAGDASAGTGESSAPGESPQAPAE